VPVHVALAEWPPGSPSEWLPTLAERAAQLTPPADRALVKALAARELALLARVRERARDADKRWQPSLFDRRAARVVAAARSSAAAQADEHRQRLAALQTVPIPPLPVLALLVR
jgi:hypothetical protein